MKIVY